MRLSPRLRTTSIAAAVAVGLTTLPALAAGGAGGCDDPIAVLSPTGSSGDLGAVAVTSQVLEQGIDGWAQVSWETFEGAHLDSVTIVRTHDEEILTEGLDRGSASEVLELIFCGSAGGR
jgi:hypothetical protein